MQCGYLSLLYSTGDKPLEYWTKQKSRTGFIRRVVDEELNEKVLEIQDVEESNSQKTWIMCPPSSQQILNVKLPFLVIILKNSYTQCYFQLQIVDKDNVRHLINFSNIEHKKNPAIKSTPMKMHLLLEPGWNKLEIDLTHLCKIFEAQFDAVCRLRMCANCRIRRIYFTDRHYDENEMSVALYQGFLDMYMLKWGIKAVDRATQTKKTIGKSTVTTKDNSLHIVNGFNKLFLKNLQAKSDKLVEEFFSKNPIRSVKEYLEFKRRAKMKSYVIPDSNKIHKSIRVSDASLTDLSEIKKNFVHENYFHGKLSFEEKKDGNNKEQDFKNNKADIYQSIYKIRKYKYPEIVERKASAIKSEQIIKYSVFKKEKESD